MLRRKPSRERIGRASYGRRVPSCNFQSIKEEIMGLESVLAEESVSLSVRDSSKLLLIHPAIKHRVTPLRPRTH